MDTLFLIGKISGVITDEKLDYDPNEMMISTITLTERMKLSFTQVVYVCLSILHEPLNSITIIGLIEQIATLHTKNTNV